MKNMIDIKLQQNSSIATLVGEGKQAVKVSWNDNPRLPNFFYTPFEMLCMSVASCTAKQVIEWCNDTKFDVRTFEYIGVGMKGTQIQVHIQRPKDSDVSELLERVRNCPIARQLKNPIKVVTHFNKLKEEDLIKDETLGCCGG
tara:strand:- start:832 stop:1260 length:429 start_codon:yes stop_codon:yes gene_type:complete